MGDCKDCPDGKKKVEEVDSPGRVVGWRIWYSDGKVYDSNGTGEVPRDGVLAVVLYYPKGMKRIMTGSDYYFYAPGYGGRPIFGQSSAGDSRNEIEARYPAAVVLRGKWTDDETMHRLDKIIIDSTCP